MSGRDKINAKLIKCSNSLTTRQQNLYVALAGRLAGGDDLQLMLNGASRRGRGRRR